MKYPTRSSFRVLVASAAMVVACDNGPTTDPALLDPPDSGLVWVPYSPEEAVAKFGRYRVDSTPPVTRPTTTPDGEFAVLSTSPAGHRVGRVAGRLAVWPADAAAPSYMFRADTNETALTARIISDRLEVVLTSPPATGFGVDVYAWRANELKKVSGPDCLIVSALNARGMIGLNTTCRLYNSGYALFSPFSPDQTKSGRFAGQVCSVGGRYSSVIAIDEENDVLRTVERYPGGGQVTTVQGTGCVVLDDKFRGLTIGWNALRSGLLGGSRTTQTGFSVGVISDVEGIAAVNDLLSAAAAAKWRILSITRIEGGRVLTGQAVSLVDGTISTLRLRPDG